MRKPVVRRRVEYLRSRSTYAAIESVQIDKTWILLQLAANITQAKAEGDHSAVNRGLELLGKEKGMFVDRKLVGLQAVIKDMTPAALRDASADDLLRLSAVLEEALEPEPAEPVAQLLHSGPDPDNGS